jgi:excisionase family DNA binding protein
VTGRSGRAVAPEHALGLDAFRISRSLWAYRKTDQAFSDRRDAPAVGDCLKPEEVLPVQAALSPSFGNMAPAAAGQFEGHGLSVVRGGAGDLLDVREVAARLGVRPWSVYRWVDSGELRSTRLSTNTLRLRLHPNFWLY